eukprot:6885399-Pyramimonas_sp.AAC.1
MKLAWEPIFNDWVCVAQRGFLTGRSMLMNIIDVDEAAMTAAFPILSHDYTFAVLEHIGLPPGPLNALKAFYSHVKCTLQFKGPTYEAFD